jgi:hypothetical protein
MLAKIPAKKTKCPYCGEFMFVRTRPKDNYRVVVTKQEADQIDEDWSIIAGTHDNFIAGKEGFEKEKEILRKRFSKEPSENDVKWGILNNDLIKHAQNGDWGLYRNTRFEMAEILRKELILKDALQTYLEVCFIDLNGPNNRGGINDPELLKEFPPFDPKQSSFLAPGVIDLIRRIVKKLGFDKEKVKSIFIEHNSRVRNSLKLPLTAEKCWISLEKEIWN